MEYLLSVCQTVTEQNPTSTPVIAIFISTEEHNAAR